MRVLSNCNKRLTLFVVAVGGAIWLHTNDYFGLPFIRDNELDLTTSEIELVTKFLYRASFFLACYLLRRQMKRGEVPCAWFSRIRSYVSANTILPRSISEGHDDKAAVRKELLHFCTVRLRRRILILFWCFIDLICYFLLWYTKHIIAHT